jgi:hypothetical protein
MDSQQLTPVEDLSFYQLRRKLRTGGEVLSSSTDRLLKAAHFTGRITFLVQNGRILKSGYEESYFTHRERPARPSL